MTNKQINDDDEITVEMVEGIWAEHQYKIENMPEYAGAFEKVRKCLLKMTKQGYQMSEQDEEEFGQLLLELYLLDRSVNGGP